MRLENKIVVITGAGSGIIGRMTAIIFAQEGAKVFVADADEEAGEKVAEAIRKEGGEASFIELDVTSRKSVREAIARIKKTCGRIDVLINSAGITSDALVSKMTEKQWDEVIDVNLKGTFNCIQAVIEIMKAQKYGVILNISSIAGLYGSVGQVNYASAAAGLIGMTKSLAKELGKNGIRTNVVAAGFIEAENINTSSEILEFVKKKTPLSRLGKPEDVAYAFLFLASDEASFVNGTVLNVDGGLLY